MKCIVCGAGGFIGWHLVKRLKEEGHYVIGLDQKCPEFEQTLADEFKIVDLRQTTTTIKALSWADELYQLAADMGGAGFVFTGENDAAIMSNSAQININVLHACRVHKVKRVFYSSSACIYPEYAQV
ncbi:MAG: NAD-dependent epimerase/dehydratase family protein, partial [Acidithiobacillus sp.]|nr:NAD-dependent epimerase/dehydratase family protein [Acidithiobacillus sp.]